MNWGKFFEWCDRKNLDVSSAEEYGERGYSKDNENAPILFANWNTFPQKMGDWLEKNANIEWSDEWTTCHCCGKAVRTSGDCYGWKPYYTIVGECTLLCGDCIKKNPEEYIAELVNNSAKVDVFDLPLEDYGFVKVNEDSYENGLHGTTTDPEKIMEAIRKETPDAEVVFGGLSSEQVRVTFDVYTRVS